MLRTTRARQNQLSGSLPPTVPGENGQTQTQQEKRAAQYRMLTLPRHPRTLVSSFTPSIPQTTPNSRSHQACFFVTPRPPLPLPLLLPLFFTRKLRKSAISVSMYHSSPRLRTSGKSHTASVLTYPT